MLKTKRKRPAKTHFLSAEITNETNRKLNFVKQDVKYLLPAIFYRNRRVNGD